VLQNNDLNKMQDAKQVITMMDKVRWIILNLGYGFYAE